MHLQLSPCQVVGKIYHLAQRKMSLDMRRPSLGVNKQQRPDQPARQRSLTSAFVIRILESIICKLATGKLSIFWIVPVAE